MPLREELMCAGLRQRHKRRQPYKKQASELTGAGAGSAATMKCAMLMQKALRQCAPTSASG